MTTGFDVATLPPAFVWIAVGFFGACVGSFLNVVIHRVPREQSVVRPPSACPHCERRIKPWENLPILSWLALRGRCAGCHASISWRYPAVEALGMLLALGCLWRFGVTLEALALFALLAAMLAIAFIDWEFMIIPDPISLGFLVVGLVLAPFTGPGIVPAVVGALVGGGLLLGVGMLWKKMRGIDAMGGGDIKLMAAVGAFLGALEVLLVIFVGAFLGALVGAIVLKRTGQAKIAFGTFLAAATVIVVFVGDDLIAWYAGFLTAPR